MAGLTLRIWMQAQSQSCFRRYSRPQVFSLRTILLLISWTGIRRHGANTASRWPALWRYGLETEAQKRLRPAMSSWPRTLQARDTLRSRAPTGPEYLSRSIEYPVQTGGDLSAGVAGFQTFLSKFDDCREKRNRDDNGDHHVNVFMDVGDHLAEEVTAAGSCSDPPDSAEYVVAQKTPVLHRADSGHDRGKSSDDRDETRNDNGESSVPIVKFLGGYKVLSIEKERVVAGKYLRAGFGADVITDGIAKDRSQAKGQIEGEQVKVSARGEEPRSNQERISGKKKADQ